MITGHSVVHFTKCINQNCSLLYKSIKSKSRLHVHVYCACIGYCYEETKIILNRVHIQAENRAQSTQWLFLFRNNSLLVDKDVWRYTDADTTSNRTNCFGTGCVTHVGIWGEKVSTSVFMNVCTGGSGLSHNFIFVFSPNKKRSGSSGLGFVVQVNGTTHRVAVVIFTNIS